MPSPLTITTPLGADAFAVAGFTGREAISELFELRVDLEAPAETPVAFDRLLGQPVTLGVALPDATLRHFHGIVRALSQGATTQLQGLGARTAYRITVVPKLWLLTRTRRSRIFQQKSVPDILAAVLTGLDVTDELQGTFEPRNICVQYDETDFAFASRLMEEEGIYYYFKHTDGAHTMLLGNTPQSHVAVPHAATIAFDPIAGGTRPDDVIWTWDKRQALTSGKVTLRDHHFELPTANLDAAAPVMQTTTAGTVTHKLAVGGNDAFELYEYPGGYAKRFDGIDPGGSPRASDLSKVTTDNARTAKLRMAAEEASAIAITGTSACRQMTAGHKFTLDRHDNGNGAYVLTSVEHTATSGDLGRAGSAPGANAATYENRFTCIPTALPFHPPRLTPRPVVRGCQTAVVVGPSGEEIFTDKYGRVKVQFFWDREGQKNADSSCWVRVASTWAGNTWGAVRLPRVGQEAVVDFLEGDPDRPIITGSVYNAEQMPPYTLPDNKTQSGVKSRSTPDGTPEMANELRFEDKKDAEHVYLHAQKDLQVKVENDETRDVLHDRVTTVTNADTRTVKEADDTITVEKGNRAVKISKGNHTFEVTEGDETIQIAAGKQTVTVKSDQTVTVQEGKREVTIQQGNDILAVKSGNLTITLDAGNVEIKASAGKITLDAAQGIDLKVGSTSIALTPAKIAMATTQLAMEAQAKAELKAAMVNIEAQAKADLKGALVGIQAQGVAKFEGAIAQINASGILKAAGSLTMLG